MTSKQKCDISVFRNIFVSGRLQIKINVLGHESKQTINLFTYPSYNEYAQGIQIKAVQETLVLAFPNFVCLTFVALMFS